mgnify:CR=1 FL=1
MKKYIIWLVIMATIEIALSLYLTVWREHFWNAVSQKESVSFLYQICIFLGVALVIGFVIGVSGYLVSLAAIEWRKKLNAKIVDVPDILNANQRIQEDCKEYPDLFLRLSFEFAKAMCSLVVFSVFLVLTFSWVYLAILIGYCLIGTGIAHRVAKPLIKLNYESQQAEATYRNNLKISNLTDCIMIMFGLAKKQKHLTYFQQFYGQVGVLIPIVIIAPYYFSSAMTIGLLMRFNSMAVTIIENTSYGINVFDRINRLISCRQRLKEINLL